MTLREQYMVDGLDSISITQFPAMICSVSAEGSLNRVAHSIQIFLLLTLSKSFLFNLCAFGACLPLSSAQSYLVRFQPSHDVGNQTFVSLYSGFIITLTKQLTCNVGIISLIIIFGLDNQLARLVSGHRNCRQLCSLHNLFSVHNLFCSQFITFEQVTLYSAYCAWFVALLASPYVVLLRTCSYLFLAEFDSSVYIRIQFELP